MDYQELYSKYQAAIKLRELNCDSNYKLLKEIFLQKILSSINCNSQSYIMPYIAGIKDVFSFTESEGKRVDFYREELDRVFAEKNNQ